MKFHGGVHTDDDRVNAKVEASLNLRFAESGTKNNNKPGNPGLRLVLYHIW